jgi:hypothetical protein
MMVVFVQFLWLIALLTPAAVAEGALIRKADDAASVPPTCAVRTNLFIIAAPVPIS